MTFQTLLAILVVAVVVIALIAFLSRRRSGLRPLPEGARERYATTWRAIEARFVDDPRGAVREADGLVVAVVRERHRDFDESRPPRELREARESARVAGESEHGGTDELRSAMLRYRAVLDDMIGSDAREAAEPGRREVAS
jgi:hypothetical protein